MKKLLWVSLLLPLMVQAQITKKEETKPMVLPLWTVWLDVINFQANYPAVLLAVERQLGKDFAIHQELGMVIVPEAYNGSNTFDKYLGFKGRTEVRLYSNYNEKKRARDFISIDFAYQYDQYVQDYQRDMGNFFMMESGRFTRTILGSHIRIGSQRFVANDRIIISGSLGLGRSFYKVTPPPKAARQIGNFGITDYPPLDPFSANIRLKVGVILGKLPK